MVITGGIARVIFAGAAGWISALVLVGPGYIMATSRKRRGTYSEI